MIRLRLAEVLRDQDMAPDLLARCARVPTRVVLDLLGPEPPHVLRLALLDRLALVLDVSPVRLLVYEPDLLAVSIRARDRATPPPKPDLLADLEAEWRAEFAAT